MTLTFGSLFAGIGGLDLGLERAGMRCAWQVEIDPYATKVLEKHWPGVERFRDVREVGAHNLKPVDLICGGFPCQDITNAGRRAGIDGERSGLWSEFFRLVREIRPLCVLVENSSALLGRGLDRVLGDLASLWYDASWDCIPAAAIGAPHLRDRCFVVGWSQALGHAHSSRPPLFQGRQAVAELARLRASNRAGWWDAEPAVARVDDGVSRRVDRSGSLGNAVVPQVAEFIGHRILVAAAERAARAEGGGR